MPSENKTPNYGLNQWQGNEYPKREDFNGDNAKIDTVLNELETEKAPREHTHSFSSLSDRPSTYPPSEHTHSYIPISEKGQPNGVAELDENEDVPVEQLNNIKNMPDLLAWQKMQEINITEDTTQIDVDVDGKYKEFKIKFDNLASKTVAREQNLVLRFNNDEVKENYKYIYAKTDIPEIKTTYLTGGAFIAQGSSSAEYALRSGIIHISKMVAVASSSSVASAIFDASTESLYYHNGIWEHDGYIKTNGAYRSAQELSKISIYSKNSLFRFTSGTLTIWGR